MAICGRNGGSEVSFFHCACAYRETERKKYIVIIEIYGIVIGKNSAIDVGFFEKCTISINQQNAAKS